MRDWQKQLEARANAVYEDSDVLGALVERHKASWLPIMNDVVKAINQCCETGRYAVATDMLTELRNFLLEEQRKAMHEGYRPNASDDDRTIADRQVEFTDIYLDLVNDLLDEVRASEEMC